MSYIPLEIQAINFRDKVVHLNRRNPSPTELPEAIAEFRADSSFVDDGTMKFLFDMHDIIKETGELQKGWKCLT